MLLTLLLSAATCLFMVLAVLFIPKIRIGIFSVSTYWVVTLTGAVMLLLTKRVDFSSVIGALLEDTAVNPIKILVLFISMTILSVFLDELGFFRYLASVTLRRAGRNQIKLFLLLYITVSILTVFTSNDIIILSFTPFICYFAKNAGISPIPYLAAEFIAANTWSMALIIGNPTNIYLVTATGGDFISYLKIMFMPTLISGIAAFCFLLMMFGKKLSEPINARTDNVILKNKVSLWVSILHLSVCTVMLAVSSYLGLEMWLISLVAVISLFLCEIIICIIQKRKPAELKSCLCRAPWELIPFILSMFIMVEAFDANNLTSVLYSLLGETAPVWKYGISSFFVCNLINNIPMSVLYSSILASSGSASAIYATVVGSNFGACLTPVGALAGIMWSSILKEHGLKFGYLQFLKIGVTVAIPTLAAALMVLGFVI